MEIEELSEVSDHPLDVKLPREECEQSETIEPQRRYPTRIRNPPNRQNYKQQVPVIKIEIEMEKVERGRKLWSKIKKRKKLLLDSA